jgi:thymidylate synthase (FAD)
MEVRQILDEGYVGLVETWGSDEAIVEAARMSTGKGFNGWGTEDAPGDEKLLAYLYNNRHATPFEMAGMVIEVKAPIFCFREWHRHRTQSYNEMSARYIPLPNENYLPDIENLLNRAHKALATTNRQASSVATASLTKDQAEKDLTKLLAYYSDGQALYEEFLSHGWPKELARLPVPVARYSRMRASANLRNWLAFLTLRLDPAAQWEIRQYAIAVGGLIGLHFPRTYDLFLKGLERVER